MLKVINCKNCGKEITTNSGRKIFCDKTCRDVYLSRQEFPTGIDGIDYCECKECGVRKSTLTKHIKIAHNLSLDHYCQKHNVSPESLTSQKERERNRQAQFKAMASGKVYGFTSENNPAKSSETKSGINSPYSMNFKGYANLSEEEKKQKITDLKASMAQKKKENGNNPLSLAYYIKRGFTEEEAKEKLKERQSTFSLEKCIEKHGKREGKKIFKERQRKWQETINNLPIEEQERIYKAKMLNGRGYSNESQELFKRINERLNGKYKEIFYATNNPNNENNEYMVTDPITKQKYFLDFYVKDINKVIEFDGDYWHSESRGNIERDRIRDENLKRLGYKILHIKERDYQQNPEAEIQKCLNFING
jgi:hypothetical protein